MKEEEALRLEVESLENMKSRNGLSEKGIELLEEKKKELEKFRKTIYLKDGEEIKIQARNGTKQAYTIIVCYKNCILEKSLAEAAKKK